MSELFLDPITLSDAELIYSWHLDPTDAKMRGTSFIPSHTRQVEEWISSKVNNSMHEGKYLGIRKSDGEILGYLLFKTIPFSNNQVQIGILIGRNRRSGVGSDALRLGISFLRDEGISKVWASVMKINTASAMFFLKNGFKIALNEDSSAEMLMYYFDIT